MAPQKSCSKNNHQSHEMILGEEGLSMKSERHNSRHFSLPKHHAREYLWLKHGHWLMQRGHRSVGEMPGFVHVPALASEEKVPLIN